MNRILIFIIFYNFFFYCLRACAHGLQRSYVTYVPYGMSLAHSPYARAAYANVNGVDPSTATAAAAAALGPPLYSEEEEQQQQQQQQLLVDGSYDPSPARRIAPPPPSRSDTYQPRPPPPVPAEAMASLNINLDTTGDFYLTTKKTKKTNI